MVRAMCGTARKEREGEKKKVKVFFLNYGASIKASLCWKFGNVPSKNFSRKFHERTPRLSLVCILLLVCRPNSPRYLAVAERSCETKWLCVYVHVYEIAYNRAVWACHPSHSMPLALVVLPRGHQ